MQFLEQVIVNSSQRGVRVYWLKVDATCRVL
ncbi:hypothetical protein QE443_004796 [Pantoea ananatis]|jgi:hypothetical protein|nr:hypothetical protein [Pantoea ananatis]MDR6092688.1 hypothetical protein [Pantoea ananatis]